MQSSLKSGAILFREPPNIELPIKVLISEYHELTQYILEIRAVYCKIISPVWYVTYSAVCIRVSHCTVRC